MKHDWITPDWFAPTNVRAFVTTRSGGVSVGPRASLNLGYKAGDDPQAVTQNRAVVDAVLPRPARWLAQMHGTRVVNADTFEGVPEADASIASRASTVCTIMIADCLPVLFTNRAGTRVAAAHAGWRGLSGGVLANVVEEMVVAGDRPADLMAWIGPGIGPTAFEVGADVYEAFVATDAETAAHFKPRGPQAPNKWLADLFGLARRALERAGVTQVSGGGLCTYSDTQRFFSYRRDKNSGRMAAFVWMQ